MSTTIQCRAKDPNTCKYHRPGADLVAFQKMDAARTNLNAVATKYIEASRKGDDTNFSEYMNAKMECEDAEVAYYSTAAGFEQLTSMLDSTQKSHPAYEVLEQRMAWAKWNLEEQEARNEIDNTAGGALIPDPAKDTYQVPGYVAGGSELWPETTGSNYDRNLRGVALKARINAELKKAQKEGHLPKHVTFKTRSNRNSIYCDIIGVSKEQRYDHPEGEYLSRSDSSEEALELEDRVNVIVNSFNHWQYDEIEGRRNMTHFWEHVNFESEWDKERRLAREAQKAERKTTAK